jgi:hypothetical protein
MDLALVPGLAFDVTLIDASSSSTNLVLFVHNLSRASAFNNKVMRLE